MPFEKAAVHSRAARERAQREDAHAPSALCVMQWHLMASIASAAQAEEKKEKEERE